MEIYANVNPRRRIWLRRLCGLVLVMALCPVAAVVDAQEKAKKLPPPEKPFDLNTATYDQFHSLPGVGPVTAQRILDYRKKSGPFLRVEDLLAVRGISAGRLDKIKQYVMVRPVSAAAAPAAKTPTPVRAQTPTKALPGKTGTPAKDPGGMESLTRLIQ
ncbi:MAG TPA: helix-hairpin-helix domain-containing protein [Candidatus Acidoferrales bacterium]|jgi:competence ComEA-like helix-hairpin-helix protein